MPKTISPAKFNPAFFVGTFDPFHKGHLDTALRALSQYKFDKIYFVSHNNYRHKEDKDLVQLFDRYKIINQSIQGHKKLDNIAIEFKDNVPVTTYHMVKVLKDMFKLDKVNLIFGDESFLRYDAWYRAQDIAAMSNFYIKPMLNKIHLIQGGWKHTCQDVFYKILSTLNMFNVKSIHGNQIRNVIQEHDFSTAQKLLNPFTTEYIKTKKLYGIKNSENTNQTRLFDSRRYKQKKINDNQVPQVGKIHMTKFTNLEAL